MTLATHPRFQQATCEAVAVAHYASASPRVPSALPTTYRMRRRHSPRRRGAMRIDRRHRAPSRGISILNRLTQLSIARHRRRGRTREHHDPIFIAAPPSTRRIIIMTITIAHTLTNSDYLSSSPIRRRLVDMPRRDSSLHDATNVQRTPTSRGTASDVTIAA